LKNRAFADRFFQATGTRPTFAHAANYSAALQYLEAVQAAGTDDADAIVAQLEGKKLDDVFLRNGEIRKADHRVVHDAYLAQVKAGKDVGRAVGLREGAQDHPGRGSLPRP
jgi:branched-chain amino acid transport system substrate-binding protein